MVYNYYIGKCGTKLGNILAFHFIKLGTQLLEMCFNLVSVVPMPLDLGEAPAPSTKELPPKIAVPGWSGVDRVAVVDEDLRVGRDRPQAYHAHDSAETGVEERSEGGIRGEGVAHFVPCGKKYYWERLRLSI